MRNAILITGLVITMMMMLECFNIGSHGRILSSLRKNRPMQVVVSALLGSIPGCIGGFASVSLYTHGLLSFGALVAMMIATSGDEAFVMLSMFPAKAALLFAILFAVAVLAGWATDFVASKLGRKGAVLQEDTPVCGGHYEVHPADCEEGGHGHSKRSFTWRRAVMFAGVALFIAALGFGYLEHEHEVVEGVEHQLVHDHDSHHHGINLLDEQWMNVMFAVLSLFVLAVLIFASDHFVQEHLWEHVVCKHLAGIFLWTAGVLLVLEFALGVVDVEQWIGNNVPMMIILAALVGIIPESGPHLVFVTLFATGMVPLPVLLASSISQDGHASIPLLAEDRRAFVKAKLINVVLALAVGFGSMLFATL